MWDEFYYYHVITERTGAKRCNLPKLGSGEGSVWAWADLLRTDLMAMLCDPTSHYTTASIYGKVPQPWQVTFWGGCFWFFFWGGGCPIHCSLFSSIPNFYPLASRNTPLPSFGNEKCLQVLPNVPWAKRTTLPMVEHHEYKVNLPDWPYSPCLKVGTS